MDSEVGDFPAGASGQETDVDRRMALAQEWDRLVDEARELKGFEDFLLPPALDSLRSAAADGPVAVVNISRWRCDALLMTATGDPRSVPLPDLSETEVVTKVNEYLGAVQRFEARQVRVHVLKQLIHAGDGKAAAHQELFVATREFIDAKTSMERTLCSVLEWLWDSVTEPVLNALGFTNAVDDRADAPRMWWCPTGPLTLLPLHAAGYHGPSNGGRAVIDRVVSSYTPTLRALVEARGARHDATRGERTGRMLTVAVPDPPGQPRLPNAERELRLLEQLFPGDRGTFLTGAAATRERVLDELRRHRWVHFVCHGDQNLRDPSGGGLLLADGDRLTVTDLGRGEHRGEFACLSACKTATGGVTLPDEVITLAAALHFTGYRHVIATLWSVYDPTAAEITTRLYERLTDSGTFDPDGAAHALHQAVRDLRERHPEHPSVWIPFTHTGP
ncbi:CHAT domain-containing protein [Streptomyces cacaoi]|uniref:CHAT domain-containing protein n=1 Tax=Streptomyces cacaoi TaxID=1898 RepID=UPI00374809CF